MDSMLTGSERPATGSAATTTAARVIQSTADPASSTVRLGLPKSGITGQTDRYTAWT